MSKTVLEIRAIAREQRVEMLRGLTCRELEILLFELNRDQRVLKDQQAFGLFYTVVIEAIQDCLRR